MIKQRELVIVGGGPAGMAAALSAYKNGVKDILILERNIAAGIFFHINFGQTLH